MVGIKECEVRPDTSAESVAPDLSPERAVCAIALQKAKNISRLCDFDDIIIAADTLVYLDGRPLGKPDGQAGAAKMLRELSGKRHTVCTGVALMGNGTHVTGAEATDVYFRDISDSEIAAYVKTGEPLDKAGAYGAQGRGAVFIERINGDFFNVMGLPLCRLSVMLRNFGVFL
jgi:septum formation protein